MELEEVAPITAVLGNNDDGLSYRETECVTLAEHKFLVQHIVSPHHLTPAQAARLTREKPDVVVFGHTHRQFLEPVGGVLFLNPGYAGKPRFGQDRSVAIAEVRDGKLEVQFHTLGPPHAG
jgi:putative phosphoesterase